ncbi:MAG: hypothetical protein AAGA87_12250 [Pseudomonadota bacterium]
MSDWAEFQRAHDFEAVFRDAAVRAADHLLQADPARRYTGFGADCNAEYGDVFLTALWSEPPDLVKLQESIGWTSHWEGAFFSDPVFEASEPLNAFKLALQEHLDGKYTEMRTDSDPYDEAFGAYSDAFCEGFMESVIRILLEIQQMTPALRPALFVACDHDELNETSIQRLVRITGRHPWADR